MPNSAQPARPRSHGSLPTLFVDISQVALHDYKTGVQRVVRSILTHLLKNPPAEYRVEPVFARPYQPGFFHARTFLHRMGIGPEGADGPVRVRRGDVFLGLDLNHNAIFTQPGTYQALRTAGVKVWSVVYDLLPILLPKAFHALDGPSHARWLSSLAQMDGLICISRAVADEALAWLEVHGPRRAKPLPVGWFHLGADLEASLPTRGFPPGAEALLADLRSRPTFLMVATLEPRKGHRQVLEGFDLLWARGVDANLLFVGREGWSVEKLVHQLRHTHPERNRRLFWVEGASDEFLEQLYSASTGLIAASEGEGFGLPLIEAAQHGLPVLARDIPVFREVAGSFATYFTGNDPVALAVAVEAWLAAFRQASLPDPEGMPWLSWEASTHQLLGVLSGHRKYRSWMPGRTPEAPAAKREPSHPGPSRTDWERTIGVDARTLALPGSSKRGIGHYTTHHLEALARLTPGWQYRLYLETPDLRDWGLDRLRSLPNVRFEELARFRPENHHLLHSTDLMSLDPHPGWIQPPRGIPATLVFYDLIPLICRAQHLDRWPPEAQAEYTGRLDVLRRSPATILTISEHTRRDLAAYLDLAPERMVSILAGLNQAEGAGPTPEDLIRTRREWGMEGPFFLVVGALDPHKRFDLALLAFARVRQTHPVHLVVAGTLDHPTARAFYEQFRDQGVHSIVFTGFLPRVELECLYRSATALLFPSTYEGFGLPVLEAMAQGCPVITTTASSLPEVAGDAALMVPPDNAEAIAQAMVRLLEEPALGERLRTLGLDQARAFTWEAVARRTLAVWQDLWETAGADPRAQVSVPRPLSVRWEGSQFVWHSLAHVNRQICLGLQEAGDIDLSLVPYEPDQFRPGDHPAFRPLVARVNRRPEGPVAVHVRHQWPPRFTPPPEGCWVMIQPWEYGGLPQSWVQPMVESVDEIWVYTTWLRDRYLESGVPADKVVVVPLGVDTERFRPEGPRQPLATAATFRFLFVGGIIPRKGLDILLSAYRRAFTAADGVCLVIKAQGGGVYAGSELHEAIAAHQRDPEAPALEVIQDDLSEADLAALYRSCHAFVLPYRGEGFGLPIAEAMASGLPVIVTGRGAAMDFTHGDWAYRIPSRPFPIPRVDAFLPGPAGFWLEEPDEAALAECLAWVASHRDEARAKGALARAHAEGHLGWERPVQLVTQRLKDLGQRRPVRFRTQVAPPQPPVATALLYEADWNQAEWAEVVLSHLTAFQPGEPVALVLPLPLEGRGPTLPSVEQKVVDLVRSTGRATFPDILILGPGDDLDEALRPYCVRETVPTGRGAIQGLRSLAGLRFAHARKQLTRT